MKIPLPPAQEQFLISKMTTPTLINLPPHPTEPATPSDMGPWVALFYSENWKSAGQLTLVVAGAPPIQAQPPCLRSLQQPSKTVIKAIPYLMATTTTPSEIRPRLIILWMQNEPIAFHDSLVWSALRQFDHLNPAISIQALEQTLLQAILTMYLRKSRSEVPLVVQAQLVVLVVEPHGQVVASIMMLTK